MHNFLLCLMLALYTTESLCAAPSNIIKSPWLSDAGHLSNNKMENNKAFSDNETNASFGAGLLGVGKVLDFGGNTGVNLRDSTNNKNSNVNINLPFSTTNNNFEAPNSAPSQNNQTPNEPATTEQSTDTTEQLNQTEQKYQDAREKEKAGRGIAAITTFATSQGAIQAASAISEKRVDEESESDMRAYLGTIKCNYSGGETVRAGNAEIEIPGGNELLAYYAEYKQLAEKLKQTKAALNLPQGLESQTVYDKAETNLYKNASIGRSADANTSLARALSDTNSADAAAWQAQKDKSAQKLKTGALAVAGGIAAGVIGDKLLDKEFTENDKE